MDLISRQAAIDVLRNQMSDWNDDYNIPVRKSIENIERLPSAEPEIIRCKDCMFWEECPSSTVAPQFHECKIIWFAHLHTTADEFCSRAKMREEGDNNGEIESTD